MANGHTGRFPPSSPSERVNAKDLSKLRFVCLPYNVERKSASITPQAAIALRNEGIGASRPNSNQLVSRGAVDCPPFPQQGVSRLFTEEDIDARPSRTPYVHFCHLMSQAHALEELGATIAGAYGYALDKFLHDTARYPGENLATAILAQTLIALCAHPSQDIAVTIVWTVRRILSDERHGRWKVKFDDFTHTRAEHILRQRFRTVSPPNDPLSSESAPGTH